MISIPYPPPPPPPYLYSYSYLYLYLYLHLYLYSYLYLYLHLNVVGGPGFVGLGDLLEPRLLLTMPVALFRYIAAIYLKSGK